MGMLAIGNGEPCPYCGEMQTPNDADTTFKHVEEKHPKEFENALFGRPDPAIFEKINMFDNNHCNECGKQLDNHAFYCSDECVRASIKLNREMRDT